MLSCCRFGASESAQFILHTGGATALEGSSGKGSDTPSSPGPAQTTGPQTSILAKFETYEDLIC